MPSNEITAEEWNNLPSPCTVCDNLLTDYDEMNERMTKEIKPIQVSQELLERAKQVREYVAATNSVTQELIERGVQVDFYFNGQKLNCTFSKDFEIRMHLPIEPISL